MSLLKWLFPDTFPQMLPSWPRWFPDVIRCHGDSARRFHTLYLVTFRIGKTKKMIVGARFLWSRHGAKQFLRFSISIKTVWGRARWNLRFLHTNICLFSVVRITRHWKVECLHFSQEWCAYYLCRLVFHGQYSQHGLRKLGRIRFDHDIIVCVVYGVTETGYHNAAIKHLPQKSCTPGHIYKKQVVRMGMSRIELIRSCGTEEHYRNYWILLKHCVGSQLSNYHFTGFRNARVFQLLLLLLLLLSIANCAINWHCLQNFGHSLHAPIRLSGTHGAADMDRLRSIVCTKAFVKSDSRCCCSWSDCCSGLLGYSICSSRGICHTIGCFHWFSGPPFCCCGSLLCSFFGLSILLRL